jgi:PBP1b-binding outer membrane lipoprotein LpoB
VKKLYILLLILLISLSGCKKDVDTVKEIPSIDEAEENVEDEPVEEEPINVGKPSPLSGIYAPDEVVDQRVVAVMFDNHPRARWQAGLKDAEVVYEFPVEAPYTRYLGLFLLNSPDSIGPIRSSRPYFVTKVLEFDAVYARVGGSEQAKKDIKTLKIADIDGLTSSSKVFWRNPNKKAPNNLYSSMSVIRETQRERKYNSTGTYEGFKFHEDDTDIEGYNVDSILINYMANNTTKYIYDEQNKVYTREKDGKTHIDESDKSNIIAKNIIIQEAPIKVIDNEGRLSIDIIGEGSGKYITNGIGKDIKWVKKSRENKTYYLDENGQELVLNPGTTWIQVVDINPSIVIE